MIIATYEWDFGDGTAQMTTVTQMIHSFTNRIGALT